MTNPTPCVDPLHFEVTEDGAIRPQPWMQWRQVDSASVPSKAGSYGVTLQSAGVGGVEVFGTLGSLFGSLFSFIPGMFGSSSILAGLVSSASAGGNKNDLLHQLTRTWTNDTPVAQDVYGLITRGGCRVSLQARSRGGLVLSSGYKVGVLGDPGPLVPASMFGVGADLGRGGTLAIGTTFCVAEERMNSVTIPLAPERTGWARLLPGQSITARVELRFVSEFWENTTIDGGDTGSESSYETGDTRLDLYAVPVL
ncbi:hypothetical protein I5G63_gp031 [Mycobacterium phage Imvubu]|uniref:Uncharacterized protein n=1 Tax=Mycobacterium phage Imvubu TaxID=2686233 RepID=A0A6B9L7L0_9CAUD|nr:hypothetical protein I5G63_gp031 [Mycobacterium phage Imvubu]QHB37772.1 hypothetical protein PBI_IMVUBU_31 [Mycobacterium phage Imvubu]